MASGCHKAVAMSPAPMSDPLVPCRPIAWKSARRCILLLAFLFGVGRACLAQAPATLSNVVLEYNVYSPMDDHRTYLCNLWLKSDGTYLTITDDVSRASVDLGPLANGNGYWAYTQDSQTTGELTFDANAVPSGPNSGTYLLTFSTPTTGSMENAVIGAMAYGSFTLRPSQFGAGLSNLSTRTFLTPGAPTIAGFVLPGAESRFVLIRAVGPGLSNFGVSNPAGPMGILAYNGSGSVIGGAADWTATSSTTAMYQNLFAMAGAFALTPGQGDACLVVELPPGSYTAEMNAAGGGNALIEIYFLP